MNDFLTLEDVNTVLLNNKNFIWHTLDLSVITEDSKDFTDRRVDFCTVSRTMVSNGYEFFVKVDNMAWLGYTYSIMTSRFVYPPIARNGGMLFTWNSPHIDFLFYLYLGFEEFLGFTQLEILNPVLFLNLKELQEEHRITAKMWSTGTTTSTSVILEKGINKISKSTVWGYLQVNLLKTDFQFNPTQTLKIGQVNKVLLGVTDDYKPNGDLIGEYTPNIKIKYGNEIIPAIWSPSDNDYTFNLNLTSVQEQIPIKFKVYVEANEVINQTETEIILESDYEVINNITDLKNLFANGGLGKLQEPISTIGTDLTIEKDVIIYGNEQTIVMGGHKFIINPNVTLKVNSASFVNGHHTLHQKMNSTVELDNCEFQDCTGLGSVIECDVKLDNLDNPTDFTTIITNSIFNGNDMCILHSGELVVKDCEINGKTGLYSESMEYYYNYPFFLYQTDGNALLTNNNFELVSLERLNEDLKFYPCIFISGANASINNKGYDELKNNNITEFLSVNSSKIHLDYYYDLIEDYIVLNSENGFCHSLGGVDYVFKTNVEVIRS